MSANTWGLGSIYGTVKFRFSWDDLVGFQNIYWVEAMESYSPNAYRFLLSNRYIQSDLVTPYDPVKDQGPLQYKDGKYYWNGSFTSEFMIEDDLSLDRCIGLDFVQHHAGICRPFGGKCEERQKQPISFSVMACMSSTSTSGQRRKLNCCLIPPIPVLRLFCGKA